MSTSERIESFAVTRALVRAVRSIRWDEVPDDAREVARHCLLDFLGVAIAGSREPLADILIDEIARNERSIEASLLGREEKSSRLTAALINGAAGHALDFDDTHMSMGGHPSVPIIPAILALAETTGSTGRDLLEAIVVGIELECRLGALVGPQHYVGGFHSTGTLGTFGAAAACAHMLKLDEDGWLHTMGLAGTQAAGLKSGFGTMAKPLHAGRAASNGLFSALAARGGYNSNPAILETEAGFLATHAGAKPAQEVLDRVAEKFLIRDTLFKYHASCYLTHAPINAAQLLRGEHQLAPDAIEAVEVRVHPSLFSICNIAEPKTGLEGKFSVRATTAMALLGDDTSDLATFSDARVVAPEVITLRDRVNVVAAGKTRQTQATVCIKSNGCLLEAQSDSGKPAADLALQRDNLMRKFLGLAVPILGRDHAEVCARAALGVEEIQAVELIGFARAS